MNKFCLTCPEVICPIILGVLYAWHLSVQAQRGRRQRSFDVRTWSSSVPSWCLVPYFTGSAHWQAAISDILKWPGFRRGS